MPYLYPEKVKYYTYPGITTHLNNDTSTFSQIENVTNWVIIKKDANIGLQPSETNNWTYNAMLHEQLNNWSVIIVINYTSTNEQFTVYQVNK